jgi:hypothetical protein
MHIALMLKRVLLPNSLWGEAIVITCYAQNHYPIRTILQKNPYELWHGVKPNVKHLHIFYYDAHIHILEELKRKLDFKSYKCIFIGYNDELKGYRFYDPQNKKLLVCHAIIFDETPLFQISRTIQGRDIHKSS